MKTKKTTLISTQTHEALTVRHNFRAQTRPARVWCDECADEALMLTPEDAAPLAGLRVRAIYKLVEDGLVHFTETPDGLLLVCLPQLKGPDLDRKEADAEASTP